MAALAAQIQHDSAKMRAKMRSKMRVEAPP